MEIQIRCFHASGSGNDVLLLQAGMPVQCHDCPITKLWYPWCTLVSGRVNVDRRNEYAALLTAMIADWRSTFGNPELPFYIVELADFLSRDDVSGRQAWAEMRKEQAKVAETNRTPDLSATVTWANGTIYIHWIRNPGTTRSKVRWRIINDGQPEADNSKRTTDY